MPIRLRDDLDRDLFIVRPPRRIVSLVPSETATLFDLGVGDRVVGRTRYCVEPSEQVDAIPVVGGTKDIDIEAVAALEPDLVLANREENTRAALEQLARHGHQLHVSFPRRVADSIAYIARLVRILDLAGDERARDWVRRGHAALNDARASLGSRTPLPVFVPIWNDPLMTCSGDTFGSDMLVMSGASNVFADRRRRYPLAADLGQRPALSPDRIGDRDTRYPRIAIQEVIDRAPAAVLLPDEPFAFDATDIERFRALDIPAARQSSIRLIDGKDLFWYGTRSIAALPRLRALIDDLR